jgi:RHS repeat-associated protein
LWQAPRYDRGFTGHEHLDGFQLINPDALHFIAFSGSATANFSLHSVCENQASAGMNGRMYDPVVSRMLAPDNFVQTPDFSQNFNRYSYALNNPLMFTDPSGEFIIEAMMIGAFINAAIQTATGNVNNVGDFFLAAGIGAVSGTAGAGVGGAVANAVGTIGFAGGAITGAAGGFAGGFVGGAGNAWMGGANFGQGILSGLNAGAYSAAGGAILGGVSGGIQYKKQIYIFQQGNKQLGINGTDPVPAKDVFLSDAQKAWYKDAPMESIKNFTVENVPDNAFSGKNSNAIASTRPLSQAGKLTGMSNVYFNKALAFNSAKELFFAMGHEFVHVSQFAALAGSPVSLVANPDFRALLDFHAYNYQHTLGGSSLSSYTNEDLTRWLKDFPEFLESMNYITFKWTLNHSFKYPF